MQAINLSYLKIIQNICTDSKTPLAFSQEEFSSLFCVAQRQKTIPFLLPYAADSPYLPEIKRLTKSMMLNYYQIEQFTHRVTTLFTQNNIPYILLKGISLAAYYPTPEQRKLGDLDLLLADPSMLPSVKAILLQHGFREDPEVSDHHATFIYTFPTSGHSCILELHYRIVGLYQYQKANRIVDSIYSNASLKPVSQQINGNDYFVLPPTEYTFYLLHHMLKHYLYSGFGIRLVCDFFFYVTNHLNEIDCSKLHRWCSESRILHFYEIIVASCRIYLGLPQTFDPDIHYNENDCDQFMDQLLSDGDMGRNDSSSLVGSNSYRHAGLFSYLKEGHLQMHVRFPKLGKFPLLWPVLWIWTFGCFLKNTYTVRHTTLRKTLQTFQENNEKSQLIRIFDNSDT